MCQRSGTKLQVAIGVFFEGKGRREKERTRMITLCTMTARCALKPQFARAAAQRVFRAVKPQRQSRFPVVGNCRNYQNLKNIQEERGMERSQKVSTNDYFYPLLRLIYRRMTKLGIRMLNSEPSNITTDPSSNTFHDSLYVPRNRGDIPILTRFLYPIVSSTWMQ